MSLVRWTRFSSFHSQNDCHNRVCAALLPFPPKTNLPARPCLWRFFWLEYRWVSLDMLLCHFPARKDSNGYCRSVDVVDFKFSVDNPILSIYCSTFFVCFSKPWQTAVIFLARCSRFSSWLFPKDTFLILNLLFFCGSELEINIGIHQGNALYSCGGFSSPIFDSGNWCAVSSTFPQKEKTAGSGCLGPGFGVHYAIFSA